MLAVVALAGLAGTLGAGPAAGSSPATPSSSPSRSAAEPSAGGTGKATFGIGPSNAKGIDGRSYLNYTTSPGGRTGDRVEVRNYGASPVTIHLYAVDATASNGGAIGFAPQSKPGIDAGRWISFGGGARDLVIRLAPRESKVVPITIAVPTAASPGDHLAGVIAAYYGRVLGKSGQQIRFEQRVALRALFRVSGDVRSLLAIDHLHVSYHGALNPFGAGSATVTYSVRNAGNVLLSGRQRLSITGIFGSTGAAAKLVKLPLLLPGASFPMRVDVQHVWPQLLMHARVTISPLAVAGALDPGLHGSQASMSFWAVPWTLLALVAALAGLAALAIARHHRLSVRTASHRAVRDRGKPALGEA